MDINYLWQKLGNLIQQGHQDPMVTEMTLNDDMSLWFTYQNRGVLRVGKMRREDALAFVNAYAQYSNQFIHEKKTYLDGSLPFNGARINITIPPMVSDVSFVIRKHSPVILSLQDYIAMDGVTSEQAVTLKSAIKNRKNILVSGGPGAGKTTLTNALLKEMAFVVPDGHRVLLLEETAELRCEVKNKKHLFTNEHDDMRRLLWVAMRNSPDRIVIGEVRDGSAYDMLKAWNTGCPGGIATIHANSAKSAMQRVLDLAQEATHIPPYSLMAEAIDVVVQIERDPNTLAGRRVCEIIKIEGYDRATNKFVFSKAA